jgi:hypothetical protein
MVGGLFRCKDRGISSSGWTAMARRQTNSCRDGIESTNVLSFVIRALSRHIQRSAIVHYDAIDIKYHDDCAKSRRLA